MAQFLWLSLKQGVDVEKLVRWEEGEHQEYAGYDEEHQVVRSVSVPYLRVYFAAGASGEFGSEAMYLELCGAEREALLAWLREHATPAPTVDGALVGD